MALDYSHTLWDGYDSLKGITVTVCGCYGYSLDLPGPLPTRIILFLVRVMGRASHLYVSLPVPDAFPYPSSSLGRCY